MFALAAVKLPALVAWIRLDPRPMAPADAVLSLWVIDKAPTLDEPAEVADRLMVLFAKVMLSALNVVCSIATELAVMLEPVRETSLVPKLIAASEVRLVWVMPLAFLRFKVPVADRLMAFVPLVMSPPVAA